MELEIWHIIVGIILLFVIFGKSKGGVISHEYTAELEYLGEGEFTNRAEARRVFFKNRKDEKFAVNVDNSPLPKGSSPEIYVNGHLVGSKRLENDGDVDFDLWRKESRNFPDVQPGSTIEIKLDGKTYFKGIFYS